MTVAAPETIRVPFIAGCRKELFGSCRIVGDGAFADNVANRVKIRLQPRVLRPDMISRCGCAFIGQRYNLFAINQAGNSFAQIDIIPWFAACWKSNARGQGSYQA